MTAFVKQGSAPLGGIQYSEWEKVELVKKKGQAPSTYRPFESALAS